MDMVQPNVFEEATCSPWMDCAGTEYHLGDARDMLDFTFSNPACPDSLFECAGTSRSPTLPTLPDLDSISSSRHTEFGLPSPASTASCTDLSEIDWDTIMGIDTAPAQSGGMQCLDGSSDLKDWAWMDAVHPTLPLPESPLDDFQYNPSDDELGIGLKSEDSLASMQRESKPRPTKKRSHNAIERKYREGVNSKLVKIDGWLFEHRSRSKKASGDSPKRTKGAILADALLHLEYLSRCKSVLEEERRMHKAQIAALKRLAAR